jgi:FixJ family two-component response regulator
VHATDDGAAEAPLVAIVDDDDAMRKSAWRLMRLFGIRAEGFTSAGEFLESGRVMETACLVLDLRMPEMDGLELQTRLRSENHLIPIIFVTGQASDEERRKAMQAGAVDVLSKPVSNEAMINVIQTVLQRNRLKENKDRSEPKK